MEPTGGVGPFPVRRKMAVVVVFVAAGGSGAVAASTMVGMWDQCENFLIGVVSAFSEQIHRASSPPPPPPPPPPPLFFFFFFSSSARTSRHGLSSLQYTTLLTVISKIALSAPLCFYIVHTVVLLWRRKGLDLVQALRAPHMAGHDGAWLRLAS